jgi:hypothetical protein
VNADIALCSMPERRIVSPRGKATVVGHPLRVIPFLIGVLATASFAMPATAWANGGGHGGGRAAAGPARALGPGPARAPGPGPARILGPGPARAAGVVRRRSPLTNGLRPIAIWPYAYPWYGVGYPYDAGAPYPYPAPGVSAGTSYPYPESPQVNASDDRSASPPSGWLEFRLEPGTAQVYVDGYYAGEVSDFDRPGGRAVEPGPHHIEIRASGYQTSAFDVRLLPDQPVTYRDDLRPVSGSVPPRRAEAGPGAASGTTFYIIAGCYMGNVPPAQVTLRPGCDAAQVKTVEIHH